MTQFINQNSTVGLFPTPITKVKMPISEELVTALKNVPMVGNADNNPEDFRHPISENKYILYQDAFKELEIMISARLAEYTKHVLSFEYPHQFTQSWVNQNPPGKSHHRHSHDNSIVSGVFYIDLPEGKDSIVFHKPRATNTYTMTPKMDPFGAAANFYAYDWYQVTVETFDLIMFPSYLEHSVPQNDKTTDRWSLAFNSVPVYALGSYIDLTELPLGQTAGYGVGEPENEI